MSRATLSDPSTLILKRSTSLTYSLTRSVMRVCTGLNLTRTTSLTLRVLRLCVVTLAASCQPSLRRRSENSSLTVTRLEPRSMSRALLPTCSKTKSICRISLFPRPLERQSMLPNKPMLSWLSECESVMLVQPRLLVTVSRMLLSRVPKVYP